MRQTVNIHVVVAQMLPINFPEMHLHIRVENILTVKKSLEFYYLDLIKFCRLRWCADWYCFIEYMNCCSNSYCWWMFQEHFCSLRTLGNSETELTGGLVLKNSLLFINILNVIIQNKLVKSRQTIFYIQTDKNRVG